MWDGVQPEGIDRVPALLGLVRWLLPVTPTIVSIDVPAAIRDSQPYPKRLFVVRPHDDRLGPDPVEVHAESDIHRDDENLTCALAVRTGMPLKHPNRCALE